MPATTSVPVRQEIRRRRDAGESLRGISRALGVSVSTVRRYAVEPLPVATAPLVDMPPLDSTLRSQLAHEFGTRRDPFRMQDMVRSHPGRHRVLVCRHVRRLVSDGVFEHVDSGLYIGRAKAAR